MYLVENSLIFLKEQCGEKDIAATFFLHLDLVDVNDLPNHRKQYGFDNLDFNFDWDGVGVRLGEGCLGEGLSRNMA